MTNPRVVVPVRRDSSSIETQIPTAPCRPESSFPTWWHMESTWGIWNMLMPESLLQNPGFVGLGHPGGRIFTAQSSPTDVMSSLGDQRFNTMGLVANSQFNSPSSSLWINHPTSLCTPSQRFKFFFHGFQFCWKLSRIHLEKGLRRKWLQLGAPGHLLTVTLAYYCSVGKSSSLLLMPHGHPWFTQDSQRELRARLSLHRRYRVYCLW